MALSLQDIPEIGLHFQVSPITDQALRYVKPHCNATTYNHVVRTAYWAAIIAKRDPSFGDARVVDLEAVLVSCISRFQRQAFRGRWRRHCEELYSQLYSGARTGREASPLGSEQSTALLGCHCSAHHTVHCKACRTRSSTDDYGCHGGLYGAGISQRPRAGQSYKLGRVSGGDGLVAPKRLHFRGFEADPVRLVSHKA
jgi:hypothetical protein